MTRAILAGKVRLQRGRDLLVGVALLVGAIVVFRLPQADRVAGIGVGRVPGEPASPKAFKTAGRAVHHLLVGLLVLLPAPRTHTSPTDSHHHGRTSVCRVRLTM